MLPELEAQRQLLAIEVASFPHITNDARRQIISRLQRQTQVEQRPLSLTDALSGLSRTHTVQVPKEG
jgi:hypothetical protein